MGALAFWMAAAAAGGAVRAEGVRSEPAEWIAVVLYAGPGDLARGELAALCVRHVGEHALVAQARAELFERLPRAVFAVHVLEPVSRAEVYYVRGRADGEEPAPAGQAPLRVVWTEDDFVLLAGRLVAGQAPAAANQGDRFGLFQEDCGAHLQSLPDRVSLRSYGPHASPFDWSPEVMGRRGLAGASAAGTLEERVAAHVESLAWDGAAGVARSRWAYRPETPAHAAEYVRQAYLDALGGRGSVTLMGGFRCGHPDSVSIAPNVIARLPGRGRGEFLVTAHYDATALRTYGSTEWAEVAGVAPAPGADDNASGVAATIEVLRTLAPLEFDFDIVCIAWACEEVLPDALWGSRAYAAEAAANGDSIWGVINMDMIGYARPGEDEKIVILTNHGSQWLADLLLAAGAPAGFDGPMFKVVGSSFTYSDHYPFWGAGYDAVLVTEDVDVRSENLQYHRVTDLPPTVSPSLVAAVVRTVTAALTGLENRPLADLALGPGALAVDFASATDRFTTPGDTIEFGATVRNLGEAMRTPVTVGVQFARSEPPTVLAEETADLQLLRGEARTIYADWVVPPDAGGEVEVVAHLVLPAGFGDFDPANQDARVTFDARQDALRIMEAHCFPNPAGSSDGFTLSVELSQEADLTIDVLSLAGRRIAGPTSFVYSVAPPEVRPEPGLNLYSWPEIAPGVTFPQSGLYLLRVTAGDVSGSGTETSLVKFAVKM